MTVSVNDTFEIDIRQAGAWRGTVLLTPDVSTGEYFTMRSIAPEKFDSNYDQSIHIHVDMIPELIAGLNLLREKLTS